MPACASRPNFPPPEVTDQLIDAVAWAMTCMTVTAMTAPHSDDRTGELAKLRDAAEKARALVDDVQAKSQEVPYKVLVELRTCELAVPKLEAGAVLRQRSAP